MSTDQKSAELQKSPSHPNTLYVIDELIISNGCPENCCRKTFLVKDQLMLKIG